MDKAGRDRKHFSPGSVQLKVIRIEGLVDRGGIELSASEEIPERLVRRPWCVLRHHVAGEIHLDIR